MNYWDKNGFIHHNKEAISENGILFTAYWAMLFSMLKTNKRVAHYPGNTLFVNTYCTLLIWLKSNNETLRTNFKDENPDFSHDNATGFICLSNLSSFKWRDYFPLIKHYSLHPRDFFFYLCAKYPLVGWLFLWLPSIAMIISSMRVLKRGVPSTSGKLLLWLRCNAFNMNITLKICEFFIFRQSYYSNWSDVFGIYFQDRDNPINLLAKEIYNGQDGEGVDLALVKKVFQ